jgi:hypothetical protein
MTPSDLQQQILELQQRLEDALRRVEDLTAENARLREQLDQAQRQAARQAAPFRRPDSHKKDPASRKRLGRPKGHEGARRAAPDSVDESHEVPLTGCPCCGGAVEDCRPVEQFFEEIPPVRPRVFRIVTFRGRCPRCGPVCSRHPMQSGCGHHASACGLGPRAVALAALLNKHHGLTFRKTCSVLRDLCGLRVSPGGLSQALDRLADRAEPDYQRLQAEVRAGPAVYADETSWWVGGPGRWLWVFTNPTTTLYRVEAKRDSQVVVETLGPDFEGVLVSDCLSSYDPPDYRKHKCIAHHQKAIKEQLDQLAPGESRAYLERWRSFFRQVCAVRKVWQKLSAEQKHSAARSFAARRDELLRQEVGQAADVRVRNRLEKQSAHLLGCLAVDAAVEATNNRAERALRPAVIARKVSCGNKTERGERTWERLASLAATCRQRGQDVVVFFTARARLR